MSGSIDYTAVLADLERRREELDRAIVAIRPLTVVGGPSRDTRAGSATPPNSIDESGIRSDAFFNMRAPDAIRALLGIVRRPQTIRELTDGLQSGGFVSGAKTVYNNLYTALVRMERAGDVMQLPGNQWGLAEWYPTRPKAKSPPDLQELPVSEEPVEPA